MVDAIERAIDRMREERPAQRNIPDIRFDARLCPFHLMCTHLRAGQRACDRRTSKFARVSRLETFIMFWKRDRNRRWTTLFRGRERCRCTMFAVKIVYCQVTMEFVENAGNARYYLYLSNLVKKMEWVFFVFKKYRTFVGDFVKISQEGIAMCSNVWNVWNVRFPIKVQLYSQA